MPAAVSTWRVLLRQLHLSACVGACSSCPYHSAAAGVPLGLSQTCQFGNGTSRLRDAQHPICVQALVIQDRLDRISTCPRARIGPEPCTMRQSEGCGQCRLAFMRSQFAEWQAVAMHGERRSRHMRDDQVKVLYVFSSPRSGSTLVARLLGHAHGLVTLGELQDVWTSGITGNDICSCGAGFRECMFWQAVFSKAYGGFDTLHAQGILQKPHPLVRKKDMLALLSPWKTDAQRTRLRTATRTLESLYKSIAEVSNSHVVVDTSKRLRYLLFAGTFTTIKPYVLHLVRDSRAVAFSRIRPKVKQEINGENVYIRRHGAGESASDWLSLQALTELTRIGGYEYMFMRYEDFVEAPSSALGKIAEFLGEELSGIPFVDERTVDLADEHFTFGNPDRFHRGIVRIHPDVEWKSKMDARDKRVVTALTWPLLMRYGYLGNGQQQASPSVSHA